MTKTIITKYKVETILFTDVYGNTLWTEPMRFKRMWKVGQTFIENFIKYKVVRVAVVDKTQIVNVEIV